MADRFTRRSLLCSTAGATALAACGAVGSAESDPVEGSPERSWPEELFKISLAQWSLHRAFYGSGGVTRLSALDFPKVARRRFDIDAVEYVNVFYTDKVSDRSYLEELKSIADGEGVKSLLIMCDDEGRLGAPDVVERERSVANHFKWVEMATLLGCHSIRVDAYSEGEPTEQAKLVADGLNQLADYTRQFGMSVLVENHGGLSSDAGWLAKVMEFAADELVGTLPDFGNFRIGGDQFYDPYKGVQELMPFAKAVSAKTYGFNSDGGERSLDYVRLMRSVMDAGYRGYVGIEYEGESLSEDEGILKTKLLLERIRNQLAPDYLK
ncbi:MAG: TIM barrel protein [Pseudomonadota bacterium]